MLLICLFATFWVPVVLFYFECLNCLADFLLAKEIESLINQSYCVISNLVTAFYRQAKLCVTKTHNLHCITLTMVIIQLNLKTSVVSHCYFVFVMS